MHTRLLCATKRRRGASERGNIALRLFASSSLDATEKVSGRNAARAQVRARDAVDAYSPLVAFSGSLPQLVAGFLRGLNLSASRIRTGFCDLRGQIG
jgi:hypothetical protein